MISSNGLRPGITIEYRGGIWQVIESMHVKPGKGSAFVQAKLRNVESDSVLAVNLRAGERLALANIEKLKMTFVYRESSHYVLIDESGSESIELEAKYFGDGVDMLKEGLEEIIVLRHNGKVIRVELPNTVDLSITDTPPSERGNTSSGGGKQATLETGVIVTVPFHIKSGDIVKIDTRSREYVSRVT
jgi:elongation factor P